MVASHFDSESELRRYEALLQMAGVVVRHRDLAGLFREFSSRLHLVIGYEFLVYALNDPATNLMHPYLCEGDTLKETLLELPVDESPAGWVWQHQRPLAIPDVQAETRFPGAVKMLRDAGINSYYAFPLKMAQRRLGSLGFGSTRLNAYGENDLRLLGRVAELVALAIENALTHGELQQEKERLQMLLEVNTALVSNLDVQRVFPAISGFVRKVLKQDFASVTLLDEATQSLHQYALDCPLNEQMAGMDYTVVSLKDSASGQAILEKQTKVFTREELLKIPSNFLQSLIGLGIKSLCCIPLVTAKGMLGALNLGSSVDNAFSPRDVTLLKQVAAQISVGIENARAYSEIAELKDKLAEEKLYLQDEIRSELNFEEIVGESPALKHVLAQAKNVASSDATVLVLGETGTGKELIARAIHRMSMRKDASFIKLNCAAIPTGLLESELFGHEKGAFTGAVSQKVGRLELADKGTLFLDEVGDIPMELQPKLLRVLQDQEFERLGGTRTLRVNVRLIAATNRDLQLGIAERQFRSDLYYRLNVFPIRMPCLRERKKDIPLLVRYFVQMYARRFNKRIETIPAEAMNALISWEWPGNVRELENFIERSAILTQGTVLHVPITELKTYRPSANTHDSLERMERDHIVRVLRETGGVIAGLDGAAARLGLKRTTLQSRIQRMGISREEYEN